MAVRQLNKLRVYHSLYRINKAFHAVTYHIHELQESGLIPVSAGVFSALASAMADPASRKISWHSGRWRGTADMIFACSMK